MQSACPSGNLAGSAGDHNARRRPVAGTTARASVAPARRAVRWRTGEPVRWERVATARVFTPRRRAADTPHAGSVRVGLSRRESRRYLLEGPPVIEGWWHGTSRIDASAGAAGPRCGRIVRGDRERTRLPGAARSRTGAGAAALLGSDPVRTQGRGVCHMPSSGLRVGRWPRSLAGHAVRRAGPGTARCVAWRDPRHAAQLAHRPEY